jgi:hypothetical protein
MTAQVGSVELTQPAVARNCAVKLLQIFALLLTVFPAESDGQVKARTPLVAAGDHQVPRACAPGRTVSSAAFHSPVITHSAVYSHVGLCPLRKRLTLHTG